MMKRRWLAAVLMLGLAVVGAPQLSWAKDTKPAASAAALLDLNTATADQLNNLPGIGPAKAKAIVEGRPYASLADFESRGIVSKAALDKFKDQVTVAAAPAAKPAKASQAAPVGVVDLNTATEEELNALPGIGAVKAKAIIEGRPYASLADFESRGIVAKSTVEKFKDQVTVAAAPAAKPAKATQAAPVGIVDLNTATEEELNALPGIGAVKAKAIIEGRPYASLADFESRGIVAKSTVEKFKDQVTVSAATAKAKAAPVDAADEANPPEPMGKIDLNSATADELEVLPGIGPVKAKAIVEGRPYASLAEFEAKGIVAKSTLDKFRDAIEVVPVAAAGKATADSGQGTPGQIAARKRIKMCGAQWRAAKADNKIPAGMSWPQFWSKCNAALKSRGY